MQEEHQRRFFQASGGRVPLQIADLREAMADCHANNP
jgi:hypothetical protein